MFDSKIIFFIIPLVIILVFAYREIGTLKQHISEITAELKQQTTDISSNVNQCVERIEKISKIHITELQNINKINTQRINQINSVCAESDNETEGLSRNYLSPTGEEEHKVETKNQTVKKPENTGQNNVLEKKIQRGGEPFMSSESVNLPIYEPEGVLYDDVDEKDDDDSETSSCSDDDEYDGSEISSSCDNENILNNLQGDNIQIFGQYTNPINLFESVMGIKLVSMNDVVRTKMQQKNRPVIEPVSEHSVEEVNCHMSELDTPDDELGKIIKSSTCCTDDFNSLTQKDIIFPLTTAISEKEITEVEECVSHRSSTSTKSKKSISSSPKKTMSPIVETVDVVETVERSEKPTKAPTPIKKQISSKRKSHNELKSIDEYTLQELKTLAKNNDIPLATKVDGKPKQYKKLELYNMLKKIKN
jgi:hypothetical protein